MHFGVNITIVVNRSNWVYKPINYIIVCNSKIITYRTDDFIGIDY